MKMLVIVALTAGLLLGGCKPRAKEKEITSLQRKQGASFVSEADFAMTLRDYARAEGLFAKATEVCPDEGGYWLMLGKARVLMGKKAGAKEPYERALAAFKDAAKAQPKEPTPYFQQIEALVLLGRADKARAALDEVQKKFPGDADVRRYVNAGLFDRMLTDPAVKKFTL